jgi:hypothetical protein
MLLAQLAPPEPVAVRVTAQRSGRTRGRLSVVFRAGRSARAGATPPHPAEGVDDAIELDAAPVGDVDLDDPVDAAPVPAETGTSGPGGESAAGGPVEHDEPPTADAESPPTVDAQTAV